jgi:hypothetical protein
VQDITRSSTHNFGVTPVVYIRQGKHKGIDGECFFAGGPVDMMIEIDYLMSQVDRGIRYAGDPLLVIERGELAAQQLSGVIGDDTRRADDGGVAKTSSNIMTLEAGGKAALLEMTGEGLKTGQEQISKLRESALEMMGGMKSESKHEKGTQSGRALEKLWEDLKLVVKRLRVPYGNRGLLPVIRLIMLGIKRGAVKVEDAESVDPKVSMRLLWPKMTTPSGAELLSEAQAYEILMGGSDKVPVVVIDPKTVAEMAANNLGITDANAAVVARENAQKELDAKMQASKEADQNHALKLAAAKPAASAK